MATSSVFTMWFVSDCRYTNLHSDGKIFILVHYKLMEISLFPADKAPSSIIIISKRYYIETLIKELGLDNCSIPTGNSTYTSCQMSFEDIVNTRDTFMKSLGIELSEEDKRLPYLYWTLKLHKSPLKHCFIAGSCECTTKQFSSLLTKILTVIKTGQENYCGIKTSHTGVNNMWILKNSTNLLSSLSHLGVHRATSIQTFDFCTLYSIAEKCFEHFENGLCKICWVR